jgi:hypothetical protein
VHLNTPNDAMTECRMLSIGTKRDHAQRYANYYETRNRRFTGKLA